MGWSSEDWAEHVIYREKEIISRFSEIYGFRWYTYVRQEPGQLTGYIGKNEIHYTYDRRKNDYGNVYWPKMGQHVVDGHVVPGQYYIRWSNLIPQNGKLGLSYRGRKSWLLFLNKCLKNLNPNDPASNKLTQFLIEHM